MFDFGLTEKLEIIKDDILLAERLKDEGGKPSRISPRPWS
jgi:hypothetical protein